MGVSVELFLFLWAWMVQLDTSVHSSKLPDIYNRSFIEECVRAHNAARSSVRPPATDMLYMTWDEGLAITARAWSKRCEFEHNIYLKDAPRVHPNFSSVGENLWTGYPPSSFNAKRAIERWVNEKLDYIFKDNNCKVCGHYTQVVWASSYKVGCAVQVCPNGVKSYNDKAGAIFVCNYATAGNMNGAHPYKSGGAPCSRCEGNCVNKLCRSKERDMERRYNWTPDWDTPSSSSYVSIVTVRPIALILTFVVAFAVRYFYPDIFFYE
ncbi:unnamed protein product [Ophioblennius macclurei]